MPQQTYTAQHPLDDDGKTFAAPLVDNAGTNEFVAPAGANRRTQAGEIVADVSVHVTQLSGMGGAFGATGDSAAGSDTGSATFISLFKRGLQHLTAIKDWAAALGAPDDALIDAGVPGTVISHARRIGLDLSDLLFNLGETSDAVIGWANTGTLASRARSIAKAIGDHDEAPVTAGNTGSIGARIRQISLDLANRLPATLGRKAEGAGLGVTLSTEDLAKLEAMRVLLAALGTEATLAAASSRIGAVTETAPGTDTASSGLNGRLQRLAQHLSTLTPATTGAYGVAVAVGASDGGSLLIGATSRKRVELVNNTSTRVWLGFDTNVTAGANGKNIGSLGPLEGRIFEYTGPLYGITDATTAYVAVAEMS